MSLQSPMVLPGKRVIRGESLQPFLSCARNCTTPATLSSAQHNSEYLIDLIVRFSTLDFLADWASRGGIMGRPEKIDPTLRRKSGLLRGETFASRASSLTGLDSPPMRGVGTSTLPPREDDRSDDRARKPALRNGGDRRDRFDAVAAYSAADARLRPRFDRLPAGDRAGPEFRCHRPDGVGCERRDGCPG